MLRRALAVLALTSVSCVSTASAAIVPQRGIAGVTLGMSKAIVRAKLGAPDRVERGRNEFGNFERFRYAGLTIFFQGRTAVSAIDTTRRLERTRRGVGVGSPERDVRRLVEGVRCRTEAGRFRHCFVGAFLPGRRVTDFVIRRGRVVRVTVGFVLD